MSARVPFMPQRPASRQQESTNTSTHGVAHDTFRPNGLLSSAGPTSHDPSLDMSFAKDAHIPTRHSAEAALKAASNKPLNLAGLAKRKPAPQPGPGQNSRKSFDGSAPLKPFLAPSQAHRLAAPRPSSPFFLGAGPAVSGSGPGAAPSLNASFLSTDGFRPPILPAQTRMAPFGDDLNANHAHIAGSAARNASSGPTSGGDGSGDASGPADRYEGLYSLGFNPANRARTASQPSLEKINEADDEEEAPHTGSDDAPDDVPQHGLRRSTKRIHEHEHDYEEDAFAYGTQAKRYKPDGPGPADEFGTRYSRGPTPDIRGYTAPEDYRAPSESRAPSRMSVAPPSAQTQPVVVERGEALYKLLGQELTVFVEGHVDAYEEAKKRWSECSMEEWRAGADELTAKFAKMLDVVKDHMTAKLSLYASLHNAVASHKSTLSERDKLLTEARESLVKEGGAVVGSGGSAAASALRSESSAPGE